MHIVREELVNTWTVDHGEEMQNLVDMGVDCISTNVLLYNQALQSSGKVKSYLFDHRVNYVTCIHSSIDNQGENEWMWRETGRILEIRGNHEAKKMLQIKLPGLNAGDVVKALRFTIEIFQAMKFEQDLNILRWMRLRRLSEVLKQRLLMIGDMLIASLS